MPSIHVNLRLLGACFGWVYSLSWALAMYPQVGGSSAGLNFLSDPSHLILH